MGVTAPRQILKGETYLVTRRCSRREYLLRPDDETNEIFAYCLAEAAARHGVHLVAWTVMSNHYHAVVHDPDGRIPAFIEQLHKMIAKVMNARLGRWENFWSSEETCLTRLITAHDIFDKVVYVLANPVNDHLVEQASDWPGLSSLRHLEGRTTLHRRPRHFFRSDSSMPESVKLTAVLPPRVSDSESVEEWTDRVKRELARREGALRAERALTNTRVLGRQKVRRMARSDAPKTETDRGSLRPCVACKDTDLRIAALRELKEFRERYADARLRWVAAKKGGVVFPRGTYRFRLWGARCVDEADFRTAA